MPLVDVFRQDFITAEVNTSVMNRLAIVAPVEIEEELADAFDHIKRKFFKKLRADTKIKHKRIGGTGLLSFNKMRSYINRTKGKLERLRLGVFTRSKAAELHEEGGTVTKQGGALAIPIGEALTPTGRVKRKYNVASTKNSLRSIRDIEGLFPVKVGGKLYLAKEIGGRNARISFLFKLQRSAKIPARLGFEKTWDALETFRTQRINQAIDKALRKAERRI